MFKMNKGNMYKKHETKKRMMRKRERDSEQSVTRRKKREREEMNIHVDQLDKIDDNNYNRMKRRVYCFLAFCLREIWVPFVNGLVV
jgi:hypothetical protein